MKSGLALTPLFLVVVVVTTGQANEGDEWFERRVRPLLVAKCLECHGDSDPEAGLRLTSRALLLRGGESGPAVVAGQTDKSLLIQAVRHSGRLQMPPTGKLTDDEVAALVRWVELGLPWPETARPAPPRPERQVTAADRQHWSFRPIAVPQAPDVRQGERAPSVVDRFVLARLEAAGLDPAPTVDRRTLLRRVYYDLAGLPPTWEEVQEFEAESGPTDEVLGRVVDRLLASPRYGERWARHWLDVARFADTKDGVLMYGDERIRPYAYTYRDYVIRAFNDDLPFDRFVHEQLAADLLEPKVEPWRLAAMGLLTLGRMYDNNVHDIIDDQIDVVGRGFLGLTVACARCHDHKYDPIPMADYYSLYGVFASSEAPLEPPLIDDPRRLPGGAEFEAQVDPKRADLRKFVDDQFTLLSETARRRTPDYLTHVATTKPDPLETAIFFLSLAPEDLRPPITARWRRLLDQRARPEDPVFGIWHELMSIPDDGTASFASAAAGTLAAIAKRPAGVEDGQVNPLVLAAFETAKPPRRVDVARVYGELLVRVYEEAQSAAATTTDAAPLSRVEPARRQLLALLAGPGNPVYFPKSQTRRYMSRQETDAFGGKVKEIDLLAVRSPAAPARAMVLNDAPAPVDPRIFTRGNPSQPGRVVPRQFLEIASPHPRRSFDAGSGRLALAQALTAPDNPLTARVIVNRIWMAHFGEPLVATPSDLGLRAPLPTHPELLDRLAGDLVREGWSLKNLHRRLVLTRLFQQSTAAAHPEQARSADPDNRLLSRLPRQRLSFEAMRDTLLAISGRLEHRLAGRPVDVAGDPAARVRTVYALVDRQSLPGLFRAFDFATPDQSVERRPRTMVPQQALFALNSPFMLEQTRNLIARPEMAGEADVERRLQVLYRIVFARSPSTEELTECRAFVEQQTGEPSQLSRWQQLAQVLLSSNELLYLD